MHYAGDVAEEGDIMQELEWVELVAKIVKPELTVLGQSLDIQTQVKIAYGYEILPVPATTATPKLPCIPWTSVSLLIRGENYLIIKKF
jgi:hypothetical protein